MKFKTLLSNRIEVTRIVEDKCRVMDSKKTPLMINLRVFEPKAGENTDFIIMSKSGDDLR